MSERAFTESDVEEAARAWLEGIGWPVALGPDIAPETPGAERHDYAEVALAGRLRDALARLNPALPAKPLAHPAAARAPLASRMTSHPLNSDPVFARKRTVRPASGPLVPTAPLRRQAHRPGRPAGVG